METAKWTVAFCAVVAVLAFAALVLFGGGASGPANPQDINHTPVQMTGVYCRDGMP